MHPHPYNPSPPEVFDRHTAAVATPDLVGRQAIKETIRQVLVGPGRGPRAIILTGQGGNGKTRLINEALRMAQQSLAEAGPAILAGRASVDFYHIVHHTANGLAQGIYQSLSPAFSLLNNPLANYEIAHQGLARMWLSGETTNISGQMEIALQRFDEDMAATAKDRRIVLALDTVERLFYGGRRTADGPVVADAWAWLLARLPKWGDVALLVAGRTEAEPVFYDLIKALPGSVTEIHVGPFDETESLAYFDAVGACAERSHEPQIAARVRGLGTNERRLAHLLSGGRPILLALLVDYLATNVKLPDALNLPLAQVEQKLPSELAEACAELEKTLINELLMTRGIGDTLRALGRLRKGADPDLLSRVMPCSLDEARRYLKAARGFSFVKVRPSDERVFLHDEMYALLDRYVYVDEPGAAPEIARYEQGTLTYHKDQNQRVRDALNEVFAPIESKTATQIDMNRVSQLYNQRQGLLAEIAYYRLRHDPVHGYMRCYRCLREAVLTGDLLFYLQIRLEIQSYLSETGQGKGLQDLYGLNPDMLCWELDLLPVAQALIRQDAAQIEENINRLRAELLAMNAPGQCVREGVLNTLEAGYLINMCGPAGLSHSKELLNETIASIVQYLKDNPTLPKAEDWFARVTLGIAYRRRGLMYRLGGLMQAAIADYQRAARLLRQVDLRIELAITLNDMGYAMAELGNWADARALIKDALDLRRYLGPRGPVALSLNTLSLINTREGNQDSAIDYACSALAVSRATGNRYATALALNALAEAQRRKASTLEMAKVDERITLLQKARANAREALEIFTRIGDGNRQVDALIEIGCADRDWVKFRKSSASLLDDIEKLIQEGAEALREAAQKAGTAILYRKVDALVNLAWLGYFSDRHALIDEAERGTKESIPAEYFFDRTLGRPQLAPENAQLSIWPQIGKLHVVHGMVAFDQFKLIEKKPGVQFADRLPPLLEATDHFLWGLEYSILFAEDYQGMRKAKDDIYERLKVLQDSFLVAIAQQVKAVEQRNNIKESEMQRLLKARAIWCED